MADDLNGTDLSNTNPTGSENLTAPELKSDNSATPSNPTLPSPEDVKNLQAQRDSSNEDNRQLRDQLDELTDVVIDVRRDKEISKFLSENKDDYPYVEADDLISAGSPEEIKELADAMQARVQKTVQSELKEQNVFKQPRLSDDEKAAKIEQLRNSNAPDAFEQMIKIRTQS